MFLAERGWHVVAIDYLPRLLEKLKTFARDARVANVPQTLDWDIEKMHAAQPLHERFDEQFDLIHVSRYLVRRFSGGCVSPGLTQRVQHRPLFDSLRKLVRPGGFILFSTFMRGCELFGKPRQAKFILEQGELKEVFAPPDFLILDYRETRADDLRPLQHICVQRLPEGVTVESLAQQAIAERKKRKTHDE